MKRNKSKQLEFWYKMARSLAVTALLFWALETSYFLAVHGWHWFATDPLEIWADRLVMALLNGTVFCLLMCLLDIVESEISLRRGWEGIVKKMDSEDAKKILQGLKDEDLEPWPKPDLRTKDHHPEKSAIRNPKSAIE